MLRFIKQSLAIASIVAFALSVIFWMRSQRWQDTIYYVPSHMSRVHRIDVYPGRFIVSYGGWTNPVFQSGLLVSGEPYTSDERESDFMRGFFGLKIERHYGGLIASMPYWFLTLLFVIAATLLNIKQFRHFGLKHALTAMSLAAVILTLGIVLTTSTTEFLWQIW